MKSTKSIIPGIFVILVAVGVIILIAASDLSNTLLRNFVIKARPGTRVTLQASNCPPHTNVSLMIKTRQIVQQRLTSLGIANATVEIQDACHLMIDFAAPDNLTQTIDDIRQTGRLEFVDAGADFYSAGIILRTTGNPSPTLSVSNTLPTTIPDKVYRAIVTGADLLPNELKVVMGGANSQQPEIAFKLERAAAQRFEEFTSTYNEQVVGKQYYLCIVLDNRVESCPSIQMPIPGGGGVITVGQGGPDEAQRLANLLRFGSLPYELKVIQIESLSAESKSKP